MRGLRYAYRLPWLLAHVLIGVLLAFLLLNPVSRLLLDARSARARLIPWWSRGFLRVFRVTVRLTGKPREGPVLIAANHLSWVDIEVLHSVRLMAFVAKREILWWPLVGWMASQAGTIYHRRGSPKSLSRVSSTMASRLRDGWAVGLFPEGRVGDGTAVLPFHARLFQCALDAQAPVQPVALRYVEADGSVNTSTPFRSGESFMSNLLRLLGRRETVAELHFCEPLTTRNARRRDVARVSRERITQVLSPGDSQQS